MLGAAEIENESIDFSFEEKIESKIEDEAELGEKLEIKDRIEEEEKTEIVS